MTRMCLISKQYKHAEMCFCHLISTLIMYFANVTEVILTDMKTDHLGTCDAGH